MFARRYKRARSAIPPRAMFTRNDSDGVAMLPRRHANHSKMRRVAARTQRHVVFFKQTIRSQTRDTRICRRALRAVTRDAAFERDMMPCCAPRLLMRQR
jgi:hypothetical protein